MSCAPSSSSRHAGIAGTVVLALAALFCDGRTHAAAPAEAASKLDRLIEVSGTGHSTRQVIPNVLSGIDAQEQTMPAPVRAALREAAMLAYQPIPIIERMRGRLGTALTAGQIDDMLAWLESPLGRRITALENDSSEPAAMSRKKAYAAELKQRPPAAGRAALIAEMNRALGSAELAATIGESMVLATVLGVNAAQPAAQQVPPGELRQKIKEGMPQIRKESDQMVAVGLYYTYRQLSDRELESYLKFLKSPSGAAYSKGAGTALREAMLEANDRFMQEIPKALGKLQGAPAAGGGK